VESEDWIPHGTAVRSRIRFGGVTVDNTGAERITATQNLEIIVRGGGLADSIRLVERIRDGQFISHEFGTYLP
jgi:hypothetical protein